MKKISNFKVYFSSILENKYHMTKEEITTYWNNKEKQEKFDNKKLIGSLTGVGELVVASIISIIDSGNNSNLLVPVIILGGVGILTTKIAVSRVNPYYLKEYREIDNTYIIEKESYKKKIKK